MELAIIPYRTPGIQYQYDPLPYHEGTGKQARKRVSPPHVRKDMTLKLTLIPSTRCKAVLTAPMTRCDIVLVPLDPSHS